MTKKATIVETVLFKPTEGINRKEVENQMSELNEFISKQDGFISRKTAVSEDGQFLDLVFWSDLECATTASEKAMENPKTLKAFQVIDEKTMTFKHFSIFNEIQE
ncbi:hypothetical protein [uncultured Maribacter sp.]|uniref:antibiotic biosynthesis monooxygenase family protein n=1 Tax=uncultured Maribacter sp. TaxID=431308 RepID=UPI002635EBE8|nr:hypothetical protein [uncultured Maribacter sp.]